MNTLRTSTTRRDRVAIAGWALSVLFAAFMLRASALPKLAGMPVAAQTMAELGWPDAPVFWIGVTEAGFTLMFLWPRTPLFSHVLFSAYLGAVMWGGL